MTTSKNSKFSMFGSSFVKTYGRLMSLLVIAAVITGGVLVYKSQKSDPIAAAPTACSMLTSGIAQSLAGNDAAPVALKSASDRNTKTTYCAYRTNTSSVSLTVRSAKNEQGVKLNKQAFSSPVVASQKLTGYGDDAFWTPSFAQLNILKHDTWYILSNGPSDPHKRTLDQSKKLADKIIQQL